MNPVALTCCELTNPIGIDEPPRLSWRTETAMPDWRQRAYRILVARNTESLDQEQGDLWDSGRIDSDASVAITYAGAALRSGQRAFWRIGVWGHDDDTPAWSATASWEMALLRPADWRAQWISAPAPTVNPADAVEPAPPPAPLLRRAFTLKAAPVRARLYVSGLGYAELYLNGRRIGDDVLSPAFSDYSRTVYYRAYDVTADLQAGRNAIGAMLGNGWYNCFTADVWLFKQANWRDTPKLLLQLELTDAAGRTSRVCSGGDGHWRCAEGPVVFDGLRNGETYDARREIPGWADADFDSRDWKPAVVVNAPGGQLRSQLLPPIAVTATRRPVSMQALADGATIVDMGQNLSGWARLRVSGPAGHTITLRYAERLKADGDLHVANINTFVRSGEFQTDRYLCSGNGVETWEPRFTYHGFQYIRVEGAPGELKPEHIEARAVHTTLPVRGEFHCSHDLLNRIQQAARWSTLTNYHGIPTDCPHREKNGWTGDALLSAEQVLLNFDPRSSYRKWMRDLREAQRHSGQLPGIVPTAGWGYNWGNGPAWDSAAVLIPWYVYLYDGDLSLLQSQFACMKRYVDFLGTLTTDAVVSYGLGDWCPPVGGAGGHACPASVTSTAYYYVDACTLAETARLLGRTREAAAYTRLASRIRNAFQRHFLDRRTGIVSGNCQTSQACALYQGLVDDADRPRVFAELVRTVEEKNRHIDCGILGAKYLLHTLSEGGRTDLAFAIATQTTFPSWGHWISQGATTLWENWDGESSRNHHMFSDISAWFYRSLAGIQPDARGAGFSRMRLAPKPVRGLDWVRAWHDSPHGRILVAWTLEGDTFELDVTLPPNTQADLQLPVTAASVVTVNGRTHVANEPLRSGRHQVRVTAAAC